MLSWKRCESFLPSFYSKMRRSMSGTTYKISQWLSAIESENLFSSSSCNSIENIINNDSTTYRNRVRANSSISNTNEIITDDDDHTIDYTNGVFVISSATNTSEDITNDDDDDATSIVDDLDVANFSDETIILENYQTDDDDSSDSFPIDFWDNMSSSFDSMVDIVSDWSTSSSDFSDESYSFSDDSEDENMELQFYNRRRDMLNDNLNFTPTLNTAMLIKEENNAGSSDAETPKVILDPSCNVCLDSWREMLHKKHLVHLNCDHVFCNVCVNELRKRKQSCPMCRRKIKSVRRLHY